MDEGAADFERAIDLFREAIAGAAGDGARTAAQTGLARAVASLCDVWYQQLIKGALILVGAAAYVARPERSHP